MSSISSPCMPKRCGDLMSCGSRRGAFPGTLLAELKKEPPVRLPAKNTKLSDNQQRLALSAMRQCTPVNEFITWGDIEAAWADVEAIRLREWLRERGERSERSDP